MVSPHGEGGKRSMRRYTNQMEVGCDAYDPYDPYVKTSV